MELDFGELLIMVHLDDEWHSQDQEGGIGDPCRLASATEELLGHDDGFGGGTLGVDDDGRLGHIVVMFMLFDLVVFIFFSPVGLMFMFFDVHILLFWVCSLILGLMSLLDLFMGLMFLFLILFLFN